MAPLVANALRRVINGIAEWLGFEDAIDLLVETITRFVDGLVHGDPVQLLITVGVIASMFVARRVWKSRRDQSDSDGPLEESEPSPS